MIHYQMYNYELMSDGYRSPFVSHPVAERSEGTFGARPAIVEK
jgi:hypothetical protein